ncbi:MAG: OmpA family protein [bacterium]
MSNQFKLWVINKSNIKITYAVFLLLITFAQAMEFTLSYVHFIDETAEIDIKSYPYLDSLALFLEKTNAIVEIGGYTDNVGAPAVKMKLSEERAKAIYDYLIYKHMIPKKNLSYKGYGPAMPIATNRTAEGRAKNNRIEIKVLSPISTAKLKVAKGKVFINKPGISEPQEITDTYLVTAFDKISTDSTGRIHLHFNEGTYLIPPNSEISIQHLSGPDKKLNLYLGSGKLVCNVSDESLFVVTTNSSLLTSGAEFVIQSQPYYQDIISVWSDSITITAKEYSMNVKNGYGVVCYYDKKPDQEQPLPESPFLDTMYQRYSFTYDKNNLRPFKLFYRKVAQLNTHIVVSTDPEFGDQVYETISELDSCVFEPIDVSRIYVSLSSTDGQGFESKPIIYAFDVVNTKKKFKGPKIEVRNQIVERSEKGTTLVLEGKTDPKCTLLLNDAKIKIEEDGNFAFRAVLKSEKKSIKLTAIDKDGNKNSVLIYLEPQKRLVIRIAGGITTLAGGGLNASKVGYIFGGYFGYNFKSKIVFGPFGYTAHIGCRTTEWEPEGSHYKTIVYAAGIRVNYSANPYSDFSIYSYAEIGGGYWKSLYDNTVYNWAINPLGGAGIGFDMNIKPRYALFIECGLDYLRNKTKPNMGTLDINYLVPKGFMGFFLKI